MEFAETLVFVGMVRRYIVGEPEEKEPEGLPRNEVKAGPFDASGVRRGFARMASGLRDLLHLFEPMYD